MTQTRYSGRKDNVHAPRTLYQGSHITAKTHRTVPCVGTAGAITELPRRVARLQMLKERRA